MFNKTIETERLLLRPFELKDIAPTLVMEQHPEINQYTNDGGVKTYEEVEYLINELINNDYKNNGFGRFALEFKATSEFIGFCGLKLLTETNEVDLGYRLKKEFWGKGLATESSLASLDFGFNSLNLENIIAFIIPQNGNSRRVLDKLEFKYVEELMDEGELVHKYRLNRKEYMEFIHRRNNK